MALNERRPSARTSAPCHCGQRWPRPRVLPDLLAAERRHVEVAPDRAHRLVAAAVDQVSPEDALAVADEGVVTVPFVDAEIGIEAVGDGVPGDVLPPHLGLETRDVGLRCTRGVNERGVTSIEMGMIGNLVGSERTADTGVVWPAMDAGLEESTVDDQLPAAFEQVEQLYLPSRSIEGVGLLDRHPRHSPAYVGQRVQHPQHGLLFHKHGFAGAFPFFGRYDR